jgi:F0F1-type ATP synthase assembly protein I
MNDRAERQIFQESNTSVSGHIQTLSFAMGEAQGISSGLATIPDIVYPNNPGKTDLIPNFDSAGIVSWPAKILTWLSPIAFIIGWANTWDNIKCYAKAENKNFEKTLDLSVNILSTVASTTVLALILAGAFFAAPYIIAAMLCVGMSYGFFNIVKHSYRAYCAHKANDKVMRNQHLWAIPKQVLTTAINAVAFVVNFSFAFNIGPRLSDAANKFSEAFQKWDAAGMAEAIDLTKAAGSAFAATKTILYSLAALVTLGAIPSLTAMAFKNNKQTVAALKHPIKTLKKAGAVIKERAARVWSLLKNKPYVAPFIVISIAFELVSLTVKAISRTASLLLAPIQLLGVGVGRVCKKIASYFKKKSPAVVESNSVIEPLVQPIKNSTVQMNAALIQEHAELKQLIENESTHLESQPDTKKIRAKKYCMQEFQRQLGASVKEFDVNRSVMTIEREAKVVSAHVKQSFWRAEGRVEEVSRRMRRFEKLTLEQSPASSEIPPPSIAA